MKTLAKGSGFECISTNQFSVLINGPQLFLWMLKGIEARRSTISYLVFDHDGREWRGLV